MRTAILFCMFTVSQHCISTHNCSNLLFEVFSDSSLRRPILVVALQLIICPQIVAQVRDELDTNILVHLLDVFR